jgi:phosphoglycolate/pyridoxal phosphate phosphatase family enzyme
VALADQFGGLLIDLDGVVWIGREPVPGSPEALTELQAAGKQLVFVTNNPTKPPAAYAKRLGEMGVAVEPERIVTAGMVAARLAAEAAGDSGSAFVIGAETLKEMVAAEVMARKVRDADQGNQNSPVFDVERGAEAAVVVVSGHRGFGFDELLAAKRALDGGAALVATSRDPTMPMPGGEWPGTGAVLAAVETASDRTAEIAGKPERHLFEIALAAIGDAAPVAMVGDRVSSDIAGGRDAGLATILVLSGTTSAEEAAMAEPRPDHVVADLAALLR